MIADKYKLVRDSIHGNIKFENYYVDLLETPEIQRLYNIKQLGFAHLVFPGAHHTRLEHSLGVYKIATQIADILDINKYERDLLTCAALLHDIGHGPFSHTLESILLEKFGVNHIDLTEKLILGNYDIFEFGEKRIIRTDNVSYILEKEGFNKKEIIDIVRGKSNKKPYLSQILNGTIDADQLDYLVRDAYYTGVAYGMIDIERLLQTLKIYENNLIIDRKGVSVVENILMSRGLMYSSVYFHKTVRIAELMLSKAIEKITDLEPFEFFRMTDAELLNYLKTLGNYQYEIITRLKYRKLFKQAYMASNYQFKEHEIETIKKLENSKIRRKKEREFEEILDIKSGHVIIDVPHLELIQAEPRINQTEISVLDKIGINALDSYTPVAEAIRSRVVPDWIIMVITDEKYREIVSSKAEKILFG